MITRKLVRQGAATLMVSIPAKWAKQNSLDKGSVVEIEEQGNNLIIKRDVKAGMVKIDVSGYSTLVSRVLLSLYLRGVEEIEVSFSNPNEIKKFQKETINELLGFEIIKQSNTQLIIKDITKGDVKNIEEIIERIFLIIDGMLEELINSIEKKEDITPIIEMDLGVNKFTNYCLRVINTQGYQNNINSTQLYNIIYHLEEIGDIIKKIAKESENKKIDKNQKEAITEVRNIIQIFKDSLVNFDKIRATKIADIYEDVKKRIKNKNQIDLQIQSLLETTIRINNFILVMKI